MAKSKLCYLIADNFLTYYKAQVYHLNVTGPDFTQLHSLFGDVYDKLWEWHDTLSEQLRQAGEPYTLNLKDIYDECCLKDDAVGKNGPEALRSLSSDLGVILSIAAKVYGSSDPALETVIGDYCADVKKLKWKIDATIGK
jgi:starvation-inducible DNA-binding protein